jgi:hypothetical protein
MPEYTWTMFEMAARRLGYLDEADRAREKAHAENASYPFLHFRGRQTTGDCLTFQGRNLETDQPPAPAERKSTPTYNGSLDLFAAFRR